MVWVILSLIALVVSGVILSVLGGVGGIGLLVALNGFSEAEATPILACFGLFAAVTTIGLTSLINRWVAHKWFAEAAVPLWLIILLSLSMLMVLIVCVAGFVVIGRL
jgi:hypothetical protein